MMQITIKDGENESRYEAKSLAMIYLDDDGRPQFLVRGSIPIDPSIVTLLLLRLMK